MIGGMTGISIGGGVLVHTGEGAHHRITGGEILEAGAGVSPLGGGSILLGDIEE